jgi:hypothetical protein
MNDWIMLVYPSQIPAEGTVVMTKIDDGKGERNVQELKRRGRLWHFPDDSMYVYYEPTHWKSIQTTPKEER